MDRCRLITKRHKHHEQFYRKMEDLWCIHFTEDVTSFFRPYVMTIEDEEGANIQNIKIHNTENDKLYIFDNIGINSASCTIGKVLLQPYFSFRSV